MPGVLRTARLTLEPVSWRNLPEVTAIKANPGAFSTMLGGIRSHQQVETEMAQDLAFRSRFRTGMFVIRENNHVIGLTGLHERPDGRGIALRFAIYPSASGRGLASEAAGTALRHAHSVGIRRVVAIARDTNVASRKVLGAIGMRPCDTFMRDGHEMLVFESIQDSFV
ncbi:GNAT family N-acetyltransferase [Acetobacter sp. AN02]|uniref:GNAT family N-acetyltransferase n=1 Tax=Acetobacter sp. AN02 TaxID=2894186 RepID=UPI0024343E99|nr:GNAT family N-acetyltransferase [Acetobacter sp. AN02]MDG6094269.1 GNAT family N-acetyltransferase [Acetobacter sp. AN02]